MNNQEVPSHINITDPELLEYVRRVYSYKVDLPDEYQFIMALHDAYGFFKTTRGEDSPSTKECLQWLSSEELRPAVRHWYHSFSGELNPVATEFRHCLSRLLGETL